MKRLLTITLTILSLMSCKKTPTLTMVSPTSITFTDAGGTNSIIFLCNRDWTVSSSDSWCTVSPSSGSASNGKITITLSCIPNEEYDSRNCRLTIKTEELSEVISVEQGQLDAILFNNDSYTVSYGEEEVLIDLETNTDLEVICEADWIHYVETKGLEQKTVVLAVNKNETYEKRSSAVIIKQKNGSKQKAITISQNEKPPINLSENGTANCYIVPLTRDKYSFDAGVKGNGVSSERLEGGESAFTIWEIIYDVYNYHKGFKNEEKVVYNVNYDKENNVITFFTRQIEGSALIALTNSNNEILWSWHIWSRSYNPERDYVTLDNGIIIQDRHLGATSDDDLGMYYQWGRKDPFPYISSASFCVTRNYSPNEKTDIAFCNAHPDYFIIWDLGYTGWDWNINHTARWSSNKTIYDPCPPGWKVIDGKPFSLPTGSGDYYSELNNNCLIVKDPLCKPSTKFRISGRMHGVTEVRGLNDMSWLWTNYGYYDLSYCARFMSFSTQTVSGKSPFGFSYEGWARGFGSNVRCQKE